MSYGNYLLTNEMVNNAIAAGEPLVLKSGVYTVSETISLTSLQRLKIIGQGQFDPSDMQWGWQQLGRCIGTVIRYAGAPDKPVFDLTSGMDVTFERVLIDGAAKASNGLYCVTNVGWPNTGLELNWVHVQNCTKSGIKLGKEDAANNFNTDLSVFNRVSFSGCPVGIHVHCDQSVGHRWDGITNWDCPIGIYFENGGQFSIRGFNQDGYFTADQNNRVFLKLGAGGCNVATVRLADGHIEAGTVLEMGVGNQGCFAVHMDSVMTTVPGGDRTAPAIRWFPQGTPEGNWSSLKLTNCFFNGRPIEGTGAVAPYQAMVKGGIAVLT